MPGLEPSHDGLYRAAQADFNVRGWQGRLRYTALTALFFSGFVSCGRIARPPTLLTRYRPHPRRLVICVPQRLPAVCGSEIPVLRRRLFSEIRIQKKSGNRRFQCGFGPDALSEAFSGGLAARMR